MSSETWLVLSVLVGAVVLESFSRTLDRFRPDSYFHVARLVAGLDERAGIRPLVLRALATLIIGGAAAAVNPDAPFVAASASAGLAALLAVWPPLVQPALLPWPADGRLTAVRMVYVLYVLASAFLGFAAGLVTVTIVDSSLVQWALQANAPSASDVARELIVVTIVGAALAAARGVWWLLGWLLRPPDA